MARHRIWLLPLIAVYLVISLCHVNDPIQDDETWEFYATKTMIEDGVAKKVTGGPNMLHPHGYYFIMSVGMRIFGKDELGARSVGMLASVATLFLMLMVLQTLCGGRLTRSAGLLCGVLYLLSPAVIQGTLVVSGDTAVHQFFVMLFVLYAVRHQEMRPKEVFVLAILLCLTMWIKFATPVLLVFGLTLHFALQKRWDAMFRAAFMVGAGGLSLFLATWQIYCGIIGQSSTDVLVYMIGQVLFRTEKEASGSQLLYVARWTLILAVWLGIPYAIIMFRSALHYRGQRWNRNGDLALLVVMGSVLALFHLFISGIPYSYPRYHATMLPIWALVVSYVGFRSFETCKPRLRNLALTTGLATVYFLMVGDPMYTVIHEIKAYFLGRELPIRSLTSMGAQLLVCALPPILLLLWSFRRKRVHHAICLLLCLTLGANVSLNALQLRAPYTTGIAYGESGTEKTIGYIRSYLEPNGEVLATKDIVYHTGGHGFMEDWAWGDREFILGRMAAPQTQFVVLGLHHNTLVQIRSMFDDPEYSAVLTDGYDYQTIGSYFVWTRRAE